MVTIEKCQRPVRWSHLRLSTTNCLAIISHNWHIIVRYSSSKCSRIKYLNVIWKPICDFLFVINSNLNCISHRLATINPLLTTTDDNRTISSTATWVRSAKKTATMLKSNTVVATARTVKIQKQRKITRWKVGLYKGSLSICLLQWCKHKQNPKPETKIKLSYARKLKQIQNYTKHAKWKQQK